VNPRQGIETVLLQAELVTFLEDVSRKTVNPRQGIETLPRPKNKSSSDSSWSEDSESSSGD